MSVAATMISFAFAIASLGPGLAIANPDFGFAGGGGSSSDSGGGGSWSSSSSSDGGGDSCDSDDAVCYALTATAFVVTIVAVIAVACVSARNSKRAYQKEVAAYTPAEKQIQTEAIRIFEAYQADWTNLDPAKIATYTTPEYHTHASLMIELLQNLHRVNKVSRLKVHRAYLLNRIDDNTPPPANLRIKFEFGGLDQVIDTANNKTLYSHYSTPVTETWDFIYDGKTLKLSGISQPTESARHLVRALAEFAAKHQLFYSPDWGRYALPARGLIFGGAAMHIADINNHIIGKWGDVLVQLYTYARQPSDPRSYYLVGQLNVPKEYLGVIVRSAKAKLRQKPDRSYEKFELEWPEFNKKYDVFAAKRDALPAFELLNPKYMERLYAAKLPYCLEVADNVIYIFAPVRSATEADYTELLNLLLEAYHELKM